ncbi:isochorismatase family protein [Bosea sp. (in: a-proteobacteria)]|uniref:isochorismatase family protein n=1 Tax=Bosea sp. (in: a-proteobacteria) TaxID=1871050 RepID=UPI00261B104D|nr:isochorismatase family protein [Bosea sp. (in: a-proteobacteria)]MCO5090820.1 isochorismatase family protein [Bosea sp. (in: a-proteobacteria)]
MPLLTMNNAMLVVIDIQEKLLPAIHDGETMLLNAGRLAEAARLLDVPMVRTEQYPRGLGATVPALAEAGPAIAKMSFDACAEPAFLEAVAGDRELVVCGCEAHVCVGQTVMTLLEHRRRVVVVADAIGSRAPRSLETALSRMARHGAEIVTTEMVLFEWLRSAEHPQFKPISKLIR